MQARTRTQMPCGCYSDLYGQLTLILRCATLECTHRPSGHVGRHSKMLCSTRRDSANEILNTKSITAQTLSQHRRTPARPCRRESPCAQPVLAPQPCAARLPAAVPWYEGLKPCPSLYPVRTATGRWSSGSLLSPVFAIAAVLAVRYTFWEGTRFCSLLYNISAVGAPTGAVCSPPSYLS